VTEQPVIEFFFSPGSRYSYLAASQIPQLESDTGRQVHWRPVRGTDIRSFRGRDPFVGKPVSGQYEWRYRQQDAEAWARYYGIPFREPPSHDFDFQLLARAAESANRMGAVAAYGWRLACAVYGSGEWPLDLSLCVRVAREVGLSTGDFSSLLADPETDRHLKVTAKEAYDRGAFGVPTFFLGAEMFWGNDRIVLLRHALSEGRASS
jgi:2-hydroxychromene-2-carboxylate isomerase